MIIIINKSYILALLAYTLILVSSMIILLTPWPFAVQLLVLPVLLVAGYLQVGRSALLRSPHSIVALGFKQAGMEITFKRDTSKPVSCRVVRSFVAKDIVAARLEESIGRRKHNLFIVRPMCSDDDFRLLKRQLLALTEPVTS
jgi:hypothetical protein